MSVFRKLLLAGAIVGAGLGVAILLGEPVGIKQAFIAANKGLMPGENSASSASTPVGTSNSVQLTPETNVYPNTAQPLGASVPPLINQLAAPAMPIVPSPAPDAGPQLGGARGEPQATQPYELPARARLRSEAPRPMGNEPRSPATIRRFSSPELGASTTPSADQANQFSAVWIPPATVPVGFATAEKQAGATAPAFDAPNATASQRPVSPPPWPASNIGEGSRMHIVVDGDSLERLANRYLGDPRRSREIYEFNLELLSNPNLLPIGAELKIPERTAPTSWDGDR